MNDRKDDMQDGMAEATRLTRAGRLAEATAIIQRTLRGVLHKDGPGTGQDSATEPAYRIVEEKPSATETSTESSRRGTVPGNDTPAGSAKGRPAAAPGVHSHEAQRPPESIRSSTERIRRVTPGAPPSPAQTSGQFIDRTFSNAAGTRAYKLYIPSAYAGQPLPLVIMLHGCTQSSVDFAAGTRMNVLAERDTFFVAYPEQAQSANSSKCWNWFQPANQHRGKGEPSLIAGITREIMSGYHIDAKRVYVAGMSAGGAMATTMAATYPDLYAAVGVHSGLAYGAAHDLPSGFAAMKKGTSQQMRQLAKAIPLIMFHGDRDTTVATINADHMLDQWLQGINDGRKPAGGTAVEQGHVVGGHAYTRFTYRDARGQAIVEKWIVHHAGHAWSGGSSSGSFTEPKGPDASTEMVRFFNQSVQESPVF